MANPKVINDVAVLIQAIIVRSYAARVRSNASLVESSSTRALCPVASAICIGFNLDRVPTTIPNRNRESLAISQKAQFHCRFRNTTSYQSALPTSDQRIDRRLP